MIDDIAAFIRARLDEVERIARAATQGMWTAEPATPDRDDYWEVFASNGQRVVTGRWHEGGGAGEQDAVHIALHDPAAVLRDVQAIRRLLDLHAEGTHRECALCREYDSEWPCQTVRLVASRWAHHPDYQQEWTP